MYFNKRVSSKKQYINPFLANVTISYSLKTPERFSSVLRGCKMGRSPKMG